MKLDREAIKRRATAYAAELHTVDPHRPIGKVVIDGVVEALCEALEAAFNAPPPCPRQHLSLAAEQRVREEHGPCMCPSCVAFRDSERRLIR